MIYKISLKAYSKTFLLGTISFIGLMLFTAMPFASAATLDVCSSGCTYSTITTAIAAASASDTIEVSGTLTEDTGILIDKSLTLTCVEGASIAEVDYFTVGADDVTITDCSFTKTTCSAESEPLIIAEAFSGIDVTDNTINNYAGALNVTSSPSLTFTGNTITNICGSNAVYVNASVATISNNVFTQSSCTDAKAICFGNGISINPVISGNTFTEYTKGVDVVDIADLTNFLITDNTFTNSCATDSTMFAIGGTGTISGNEITSSGLGTFIYYENSAVTAGDVYIQDNTITSTLTTDRISGNTGINILDSAQVMDIYIEDNVITNNGYSSETYLRTGISITEALNVTVEYNVIAGIRSYGIGMGTELLEEERNINNLSITHNTIYGEREREGPLIISSRHGINFSDYREESILNIETATIKDNIFANLEAALYIYITFGEITTFDNDYNVYWSNSADFYSNDTNDSIGENSLTSTDPLFTDTETYDFSISDISRMIAAASDGDNIGSTTTPTSRRTTLYVGVGLDFTTIDEAVDAALTGDTIVVEAGTYAEAVTIANKEITLIGAGSATTIIDASGKGVGLNLSNVDNSTISGFTIQDADRVNLYVGNGSDGNDFSDLILTGVLSTSELFLATINPYTYLSDEYSDTEHGIEEGVYFMNDETDTGIVEIISGGQDITDFITDPPQTWNLALMNYEFLGYYMHLTFFLNDAYIPDFSTYNEEFWGGVGGARGGCWSDDAFVHTDGAYVYTAPTGCLGGDPDPENTGIPEIVWGTSGSALEIAASDSNVIYDSTISNSIVGVRFTGDAADNEIYQGDNGMTFESNTDEIVSSSSGDNYVKNIGLDHDGISATGDGLVGMYYKMRAYVTEDGSPAESVAVTVSNSTSSIVFTGTTDATGYTSYSTDILGATFTSLGEEAGGNPHSYTAISGANLGSGTFSVEVENQTISMTISEVAILPTIISSGGIAVTTIESTEESGDTAEESTETTEPTNEETAEIITDDQSTLDEATKPLINQLTEITAAEESSLQIVDLAETIEEFDEESEEEVPVEERTEEEIIVEEVLQGETDDEEVIERAEELVREEISDSLEAAIEEAGDEGVIIHQDNEEVIINSVDDIEIILGAGKDSADLLEAKESAKNRGKKLIVIKEDSNIDNDGISDVYQLTHDLPLFDKNPDDDDFDTADEIFLGMDPLSPDPLPTRPRITNANGVITGDTPSFRVTSTPGDTVEVFIARKDKDGRVAEFSMDSLMTNVLATLSSDSEPTKIGETIIDNEYKGEVTAETPIENGEYYVIPRGEGGLGELSSFTVDNGEAPELEELEVISKDAIGNGIMTALKTASAFIAFDYEKYIYDKIAESGVQKDTVIVRGEATPGSTILITWKSVIISSVIVSDASQGKFELEVPKELTTGDHNIITYALDEKTNAMSSARWLLFRK